MARQRFDDAIVLWLDPQRPEFGVTLIEDVPSALDALHRHGLGESIHGPHSELWTAAAGSLVQAEVEPSSTHVDEAYEAFLRLVKQAVPVPTTVRVKAAPRGLCEHVEAFLQPLYS